MVHVSVTIDGKTYRMACDEGQEEHLLKLGKKLDSSIETLKDGFGEVGDQRLAIMAGIMMADELTESQRLLVGLQAEVDSLKESRRALIDRYQASEETLSRALIEVGERVNSLTDKINGVQKSDKELKLAAE